MKKIIESNTVLGLLKQSLGYDLFTNPFGNFEKHVGVNLESYKQISWDNSQLKTTSGFYTAKTYKLPPNYETIFYGKNGDKVMASKRSKSMEEAVQFHFDGLNWLNVQAHSAK